MRTGATDRDGTRCGWCCALGVRVRVRELMEKVLGQTHRIDGDTVGLMRDDIRARL